MQIWPPRALGIPLLIAANAALGQVELVYKTHGESRVIAGTDHGRPLYLQDGKMIPVVGDGRWELRPVETFAAPLGAVQLYYHLQPLLRGPLAERVGKTEIYYRMNFHPDEATQGLYAVLAWEVDGQITALAIREFQNLEPGQDETSVAGQMPINSTDRRGSLRTYLFQAGKSLRGVSKHDLEFAAVKAAADSLDTKAAESWLRDPRHNRSLPQWLLEEIARSGNASVLELALSGASAKHARWRDGEGLLMAAASMGRESCVDVLLKHKVDANALGEDDGSILYWAITAQGAGVVRKLLDAGAKPDRFTYTTFKSPMAEAFKAGDPEIIRMVRDHGGKLPPKSGWNTDLFKDAVEQGRVDLVALLLEQEAKPAELLDSKPALAIAALHADPAMVSFLLKAGARLDARGPSGESALMCAAFAGDGESMAILQKAGASLSEHDQANRTAVAWALMGGREALALKLYHEAPLTGPPASRLLHDALLAQQAELVALSLADGATLDFKADDIDDVLVEVVRSGNLPVLVQGLNQGLDVDRMVSGAWNLSGVAKRYQQPQIMAALEKRAGHALVPVAPQVARLPLEVFKRGPSLAPLEMEKDGRAAEAQVDVYIDAEGAPHLPLLRSATNETAGRVALVNSQAWRFNPLPNQAKGWRRVVIPFVFSGATADAEVNYSRWELDELPWLKTNGPHSIGDEGGVQQAAWVRFVVTSSGAVASPRILSVTSPGIEAEALQLISRWQFYPAQKHQVAVAFAEDGVVLLPSGTFVELQSWLYQLLFGSRGANAGEMAMGQSLIYLGKSGSKGIPVPKLVAGSAGPQSRKDLSSAAKRVIVLSRFLVTPEGMPTRIEVLGYPDPTFAKLAMNSCRALQFEPLIVDGSASEYPMALVQVFGPSQDQ